MKRVPQVWIYVVAGFLALALVVSVVSLDRHKKALQEQYEIIQINSAFYYMRDMYLKCNADERHSRYVILTQLSEFLSSEDAALQAVADLIAAVRTYVPPNSSNAEEVSAKIDVLQLFVDTRSGVCKASVDADMIYGLIAEIRQYQPE